jgi:hypothetical protein
MADRTSQNEAARLAALEAYGVLGTPPEPAYDDLARVAAQVCGTPISLVSFVDDRRQWFKARGGLSLRSGIPRNIVAHPCRLLTPHSIGSRSVSRCPDPFAFQHGGHAAV